ncbi:MAG: hypothetical protein C4570_02060 [Ammonifex sp.]|jgi:predicted  nucleic acid-binding Zn-ribbon protein|nr:MAG: hypothetical protein C4570_02060 [Ammonifex sp.]
MSNEQPGSEPTTVVTPFGTPRTVETKSDGSVHPEGGNKPPDAVSGDPAKGGTTPPDGSAPADNAQTKKLYAGKYETPESLEAGYNNLFNQHNKVLEEKKKEVESLTAVVNQLKAEIHDIAAGDKGKGDGDDDDENLFSSRKTGSDDGTTPMEKEWEQIAVIMGDDAVAALKKILEGGEIMNQADQEVLEALRVQAAEQKVQVIRDRIAERMPEAKDPQILAEIKKIREEIAALKDRNDPEYWLEAEVQMAKGRLVHAKLDDWAKSYLKGMSKEEREKLIVSGLTVGGGGGSREGMVTVTTPFGTKRQVSAVS